MLQMKSCICSKLFCILLTYWLWLQFELFLRRQSDFILSFFLQGYCIIIFTSTYFSCLLFGPPCYFCGISGKFCVTRRLNLISLLETVKDHFTTLTTKLGNLPQPSRECSFFFQAWPPLTLATDTVVLALLCPCILTLGRRAHRCNIFL